MRKRYIQLLVIFLLSSQLALSQNGVYYIPATKEIDSVRVVLQHTTDDSVKMWPQNILTKIFQPFFTTKLTGEGTGLGLSLSYDIVKSRSGEITIQSKQGEFTEVTIALPIS